MIIFGEAVSKCYFKDNHLLLLSMCIVIKLKPDKLRLVDMKHHFWAFVTIFLYYSLTAFAERQDILLNNHWKFRFSHQVQRGTELRVDLPHTWNAQDLSLIHI